MTREHLISKNQFLGSKTINVQGFPWCRTAPREIGINSAVSTILCGRHNNDLSPLDEAAAKALAGVQALMESAAPSREARVSPRRVLKVAGDCFERWLLKTTINLALAGNPGPRGGIMGLNWAPNRRFVEIAFGKQRFSENEGLHWVSRIGEQISGDQIGTINFATFLDSNSQDLVGSFFRFHGHTMCLRVNGAPPMPEALHPVTALRSDDLLTELRFEWPRWREKQFSQRRRRGG